MTKIESLEQLACGFFGISTEVMRSKKRLIDNVVPRHVFRVAAINEFKFTDRDILLLQGTNRGTTFNSIRVILEKGQFKKEYDEFVAFARLNDFGNTFSKEGKVVSPDGIERITDEAFDTRFYRHPTRINPRTGNNYFPAYHLITAKGKPTDPSLIKWYQNTGYGASVILERSNVIGSYVHDCIDGMIKNHREVTHEQIHTEFPDAKESQRVKECLLGFMNFMEEEQPIIISSEQAMCGEDFGFTMDLKCRLKSDEYKLVWVVDWKTSKSASDDHKMQTEVLRRVCEADRSAVVVLGNSTKKKYTRTDVPVSKQDEFWNTFQAIKELAYHMLLSEGTIKPREDYMPPIFKVEAKYEANKSNV